jgi:hypothetical protein
MIIVFILLMAALLPFLIVKPDSAVGFLHISLPFFILIFVFLACFSIFLFFNYRLFSLLEREDWPALAYYLEQEILAKGRYSSYKVRLLASSYLVISDFDSVIKLESKAHLAKPAVVRKNVMFFGTARVLSGKYSEAAAFFNTFLDQSEWIRWFYGFCNLLAGDYDKAQPEFIKLSQSSGDALITGLSAYFLFNNLSKHSKNSDECKNAAENGRARLVSELKNIKGWNKEFEKIKTEIYIAIIRKYVDEAGKWIFN